MLSTEELIRKYNRPVPRYTSYPTVPYWKTLTESTSWPTSFKENFLLQNRQNGISLYMHLPFCESLCTYCACNKKITTNHGVEKKYIETLIKEWQMYRTLMDEVPVIREIHLGGGTPTFFSPENLKYLIENILQQSKVHPDHAFSIEGHPNNTTPEHLQMLFNAGFTRVSYGVQDNDPIVQKVINRIQPFENVKKATEDARRIGFTSVNYDLIYGLPFQTLKSVKDNVAKVVCEP